MQVDLTSFKQFVQSLTDLTTGLSFIQEEQRPVSSNLLNCPQSVQLPFRSKDAHSFAGSTVETKLPALPQLLQ
jgi:hypothetical protein